MFTLTSLGSTKGRGVKRSADIGCLDVFHALNSARVPLANLRYSLRYIHEIKASLTVVLWQNYPLHIEQYMQPPSIAAGNIAILALSLNP